MSTSNAILFLLAETPIHAVTERGWGAVDLPIQREDTTNYPMVQASSIKGELRANAAAKLDSSKVEMLFGPEKEPEKFAGAVSFGDARLLLFPVRSLRGVFAWVTSLDVLERFAREARLLGIAPPWAPPEDQPGKDEAWASSDTLGSTTVVLEEHSFTPKLEQSTLINSVGEWLAKYALPAEYTYWQQILPQKLCILHEDAFRDFVLYNTEVQTHIRLDPMKKTVQNGAFWTSESLPAASLLYAPVFTGQSRAPGMVKDSAAVLNQILDLDLRKASLGNFKSTGQGLVSLSWYTGGEK